MQTIAGSRRPTSIVVEDEPTIHKLIQRSPEKINFDVICAFDGRDAIRAVTEHHSEIDLAVIYIQLPHMSGEAVAEALQKQFPAVKTIFMSGSPIEALMQPHDAFLPKPFTSDALTALVTKLVAPDAPK